MLKELCPEFLKNLIQQAEVPPASQNTKYDCTCVFFLIYHKETVPYLLAILKADTPGYAWRNQVALPGGHIEKQDSSPLAAAFRELEEEIGVLKNTVQVIGSLGHFQTIQQKDIEAFIGLWQGDIKTISYDEKEIAKVLEVPIETLLKTHVLKNFQGHIPGIGDLLYPFDDVVIWGVTARICHYFFELLLSGLDPLSLKEFQQNA